MLLIASINSVPVETFTFMVDDLLLYFFDLIDGFRFIIWIYFSWHWRFRSLFIMLSLHIKYILIVLLLTGHLRAFIRASISVLTPLKVLRLWWKAHWKVVSITLNLKINSFLLVLSSSIGYNLRIELRIQIHINCPLNFMDIFALCLHYYQIFSCCRWIWRILRCC